MAEKISVEIGLEGGDQVEQQLAAIGEAGNKAFAQIGQSSDAAAEGISKSGVAAEKAAESTSKLSLETVKTSLEIAKLSAAIALHGVEIVQAVRHHDTLIQSLIKLASGFNTATRVVAALTPELALVGVTVGSTVAAVAAGAVAFEAVEKVLTKFAASAEKTNNTLQTLAATAGQSFDDLQRGEAVFGQIGIKAETFRGTIAKVQETLAGTDVKNLTKGMSNIVAVVKEIAAGEKGITFAGWVTAEDKVKGVSIAMKQAADAGKNATQVLLEFLRNADLATAIKVGAAFGLSEADVDRVRRLGENVNDLVQRIAGAPALISPESAAAFDRMHTSIANADSAWERFKQSLGSTVFTGLAASFSATMNDIKASALNGAAAVSEALGQAFRGMSAQAASDVAAIGEALASLGQQTGVTGLFQQMKADAGQAETAIANFIGNIMRGMGASEASIRAMTAAITGVAPAVDAAGAAAQNTGVIFTQWGTVAQQGANAAKGGVQQAAAMFTSFGTVASQSAEKARESMQQAAGGTQSLSDKVAALASRIGAIVWDNISSVGVAAWNLLTGAVQGVADKVSTFASSVAGIAWDNISSVGVAAWNLLSEAIQGAIQKVIEYGKWILSLAWGSISGAAVQAWQAVVGAIQGGDQAVSTMASSQAAIPWDATAGSGTSTWDSIKRSINGATKAVDVYIQRTNSIPNAGSTGPPGGGFVPEADVPLGARGGLLFGRGTGTSDSNLAWLSRGEYVTPARAVRQPGVLAFLEALRRSGGDLSRVLDGMGRFALGGMVPRAIPAFATGGLAGGMSNVTIQFPGLPAIGGLRASSDVVDQLHKAAALAQVRSGGRKPSRYS